MGSNQPGALPCTPSGSTSVAKASDFITFLQATGRQALYTVNFNGTSKEAAAAVAFFNARTADTTPIGVDIHGTDWHTAGYWASLRASHGHPDPLGIRLWEVGNEIPGSKSGTSCTGGGWENGWTCDGTEYINGVGSGSSRHEGYLEFRAAMRAVDPNILVGAIGVNDMTSFANWGSKVLAAAGQVIDFYTIHPYAFDVAPSNDAAGYAQILARPPQFWPPMISGLRSAFNSLAGGRAIPIAVTEYNMIAVEASDVNQVLTRAVNALFLADTIGQIATARLMAANQWNLINPLAANGTDFGLLQAGNGSFRSPGYYVFPLWARFGSAMLPVTSSADPAQLSLYAGRVSAGEVSLLAINKTGSPIATSIHLGQGLSITGGLVDVMQAASLDAQSVTYNGVVNPSDDLSSAPSQPLPGLGARVAYAFPPYSITLLRLDTSPSVKKEVYLPMIGAH